MNNGINGISDFKIGMKIIIHNRPKTWASAPSENNIDPRNVEYPHIITVKRAKVYESLNNSYIGIADSYGNGWCWKNDYKNYQMDKLPELIEIY